MPAGATAVAEARFLEWRPVAPAGASGFARRVPLMGNIRVSALIDSFDVSGPGRQLVAIASELQGHGVETQLILFRRGDAARAPFESFVEAAGLPCEVVGDSAPFDPRVLPRVNRILRGWRPDIVQTHSYRPAAIAFALARLRPDWRWVGFFHGLTAVDRKVLVYHWLEQRFLRHADRVVVMSQAQCSLFEACREKVVQISNAVLPIPPLEAGAADRVASLVSDLEPPRFGVIARLSYEKGVDVFLEALSLLRGRGIRASAAIAGEGPELERLIGLAGSLGVSADVRFLGNVHPIEPLYESIDIVVLPSRSEGLPNVLLEALRAQRRIVATGVGAVPEVVSNPLAAQLVEAGSPEALADGMLEAASATLSEDAIAAQQSVLERYSIERRREAHLVLYRALTGRGQPA